VEDVDGEEDAGGVEGEEDAGGAGSVEGEAGEEDGFISCSTWELNWGHNLYFLFFSSYLAF